MSKNVYTPEQIVKKLREADVLISKGETVAQVIKKLAISDVTYYRVNPHRILTHHRRPIMTRTKSAFLPKINLMGYSQPGQS